MLGPTVPFGSRAYWFFFALLIFARGMDFFSTRVATPHLVLEGNPLARKLGWKWGAVVNIAMCFGFAVCPITAIIVATAGVLVAAHNFHAAWLMRTMGEHAYSHWFLDRIEQSPKGLYFACVCGESLLTALPGAALIAFCPPESIPYAIGFGIVAYAGIILFYTSLSLWRLRRLEGKKEPCIIQDNLNS